MAREAGLSAATNSVACVQPIAAWLSISARAFASFPRPLPRAFGSTDTRPTNTVPPSRLWRVKEHAGSGRGHQFASAVAHHHAERGTGPHDSRVGGDTSGQIKPLNLINLVVVRRKGRVQPPSCGQRRGIRHPARGGQNLGRGAKKRIPIVGAPAVTQAIGDCGIQLVPVHHDKGEKSVLFGQCAGVGPCRGVGLHIDPHPATRRDPRAVFDHRTARVNALLQGDRRLAAHIVSHLPVLPLPGQSRCDAPETPRPPRPG